MYDAIFPFLQALLPSFLPAGFIAYAACLLIILALCIIIRPIIRKILIHIVERITTTNRIKTTVISVLLKHRFFHRLADISVPIILSLFAAGMPQYHQLLDKAAGIVGVAVSLLLFNALINTFDEIYRRYEASKTRPLKSLLQVIQVVVIIIGGLIAIAILTGVNLSVLIGSIGAATAITSLIFKDSILGFVAGIQLIGNDMIRIGDWIEMPAQSADGTVVDLSMTTIKVENFDKTITSIPAYTLVSQAFINWRGMENSGVRRIKRAIYIDISGIRICDDEMLERFHHIELIRDYIDERAAEISRYHKANNTDLSDLVNGRRMTNIGTFRAYIAAYMAKHPGINQEMTCIVRQLAQCDQGVPIEIYAFANTIKWDEYEMIQADIFDHLFAVINEFGLKAHQQPSSGDILAMTTQKQNPQIK